MGVGNILRYPAIAFYLSLATGCASMPMASPQADQQAKQFQAPPDRALIYLYRNELFGAAIPMSVSFDGQMAGQTGPKTYFMWEVDSGPHHLSSHAENVSTVVIDATPGKTYYVWQEVKMGLFMARSQLQQVDEDTGRAGVMECKRLAMGDKASSNRGVPTGQADASQDPKRDLEDLKDLLPQQRDPAKGLEDLQGLLPAK